MSYILAGLKSYFIVHVQWRWIVITCLSTTDDWFSNFQTWNKRAYKRKFTAIRSFTLLILVLSKKTIICLVKTKPEHRKWQKHDTWVSIALFSHLLSFAYGLYIKTLTLLNSHLFTEGYIIFLILCIPVPMFHIFLSRNVVLKCCLLLSTPAYIYPHYMLFWSYETKHWSLKSNLNLIPKWHKLTHILFIKINM